MIGHETLFDRLLLDQTPPSLNSDFHDLFLSVKHSPPHMASLNSKVLLSALVTDINFSPGLSTVLTADWSKCHGFTSTLEISLSEYLRVVSDFQLEKYFETEMKLLPDVLYADVMDRIVQILVNDVSLIKIFPCVLEVDLMRCKTGSSTGQPSTTCLKHLVKNLHLLDTLTIDKLVLLVFDISYLHCYTGTSVILRAMSAPCLVDLKLEFPEAPLTDSDRSELHSTSNLTCCQYQTLSKLNTHFSHLSQAYQAGQLILDSLTVNATCNNRPEHLVTLTSHAVHLLSDQLQRGLHTPDHIMYLEQLLSGIPEEMGEVISSSPLYKALNFDPSSAEWGELVTQVRYGLSRCGESFRVMMNGEGLEFCVEDCVGLLDVLASDQLALLLTRTLEADTRHISLQQKIYLAQNLMQKLKNFAVQDLSSFCKSLYVEWALTPSKLEDFSSETRYEMLGDYKNVTRTINQLGSNGTGKWKEKLHRSLLINFVVLPDQLLKSLVSQAARNKALTSAVATFIRDLVPFTVNPLVPVSQIVFDSLKSQFHQLKTLKEVRQFDYFIEALKPGLSHQSILKLLFLPLIKCPPQDTHFTTLTWLQLYLNREPFYNFSLFYELVRIWASSSGACSELLDDGGILDTLSKQVGDNPKEAYLILKMVTQGWGWRAGLRFHAIVEEPKIKLSRMVGGLDLSEYVLMDCLTFVDGDFKSETDNMENSLEGCVLQITKFASYPMQLKLLDRNKTDFTEAIFKEFNSISSTLRSYREFCGVFNFLRECFSNCYLDLLPFLVSRTPVTSPLGRVIEQVSEVCRSVNLDYQTFLFNDILTFAVLAAVSGNPVVVRWLGKICETDHGNKESTVEYSGDIDEGKQEIATGRSEAECAKEYETGRDLLNDSTTDRTSPTRHFLLVCVVLKILGLKSLETLALSLASSVDITSPHVEKALSLLPDKLRDTLTLRSG